MKCLIHLFALEVNKTNLTSQLSMSTLRQREFSVLGEDLRNLFRDTVGDRVQARSQALVDVADVLKGADASWNYDRISTRMLSLS